MVMGARKLFALGETVSTICLVTGHQQRTVYLFSYIFEILAAARGRGTNHTSLISTRECDGFELLRERKTTLILLD